ncbi:uncharacterized protein FA14DRAFT_161533 [Meira miltonrushii]|uniref:CBS domain-containing protein n=1 Tax=Meira miltonrushii TaxID=1280837 RepID=A0A316VA17_9BASI|nr:uncharacterized protein FA14DRAFT_161533 [Meira miltonrushii]PWN33908.1 hypothetical protein FA14DRAFT_161533 [Meira miltonrushii]
MASSSTAFSGPIPPPRSLPVAEPSPATSSQALKYRGATVEDLQLSPAVSVPTTATIQNALDVAFDHDYEQLPVLSSKNGERKLVGYLDIKKLRLEVQNGKLEKTQGVLNVMVKFGGAKRKEGSGASSTFTLISPETGLGELEAFLTTHPFALVTDASRSFVLAVATRDDLQKYAQRRGLEEAGTKTPTQDTDMLDDTVRPGGVGSSSQQQPLLTRREEEEKRKDRTLAEFLQMLDGYRPLIPDQVTEHYLEKVGFECEDVRLKRLLSLAAEKFVADIAADAFQYARIRTNAGPGARGKASASGNQSAVAAAAAATAASSSKDRSRTVLTMDDLSAALGEYGINARRADFYR